MALSFRTMEENVLMSMSVDWNLTSAVTNVSMRKEVTVVHAPKIYFSLAMAKDVNIKIFVHSRMANAVRFVSSIIIVQFVHVEKDLQLTRMIVQSVMISMNAALSISK